MSRTAGEVLLETSRLRLRRFGMSDLQALVDLDGDREVMRYISRGRPTPRQVLAEQVLPRWLALYASASCVGFWAAEAREGGDFIGWFHLRPDRFSDGEMELGYRLRRSVWGAGLATEGAIALVEAAVSRYGSRWICARTLVGNAASRRVMEKCGLRLKEYFSYPAEFLPGWSEEERRAVKYVLERGVPQSASVVSRPPAPVPGTEPR